MAFEINPTLIHEVIYFYYLLEIKPYGLKFKNSRCLFLAPLFFPPPYSPAHKYAKSYSLSVDPEYAYFAII